MEHPEPAGRQDLIEAGPPGSAAGEETAWDTAVSTEGPTHFRPDIEGLRAVAILAVLAFHARIPWVPGGFIGVDVFFVISGYLITGLLLREFAASGRIDLLAFYARRARRLLPAALAVIVVTVVVAAIVLSPLRFPSVAGDGAAAAVYFSNYRFALQATDYFAADLPPSPLLHYWSLGVEEQFYLFWPVLVIASARLLSVRRLWIIMAGLAVASFAFSLVITEVEAPWAFYSLPTRAWQLALGALVAIAAPTLATRRSRIAASVAGGAGLALVGAGIVLITGSTPFPGFAALLPAGGAVLLIASGEQRDALVARALAIRPARWLGRISYSLYLWHWPILILGPVVIGHGGWRVRLFLAALSIVAAALSTRFVEAPFRVSGRLPRIAGRRTLIASGTVSFTIAASAFMAGGGLAALGPGSPLPTLPTGAISSGKPVPPAAVLSGTLPDDLQPPLIGAFDDKAKVLVDGCRTTSTDTEARDCIYGDPNGTTTVVLFGDSHAAMWQPALEALATERHWRIMALIKTACAPADVTVWSKRLQREFRECDIWRELALKRIEEVHPDIIVYGLAKGHSRLGANGQLIQSGHSAWWREAIVRTLNRLSAASDRVILMGEPPRHKLDPAECLAAHARIEDCPVPASELVDTAYQTMEKRAAREAGVQLVRTTEWFCREDVCPLIMGHYLVYRDVAHITATIAAVLAKELAWALDHPG